MRGGSFDGVAIHIGFGNLELVRYTLMDVVDKLNILSSVASFKDKIRGC